MGYQRRVHGAEKWTEEDNAMSLDAIQDKINHLQGRINVLFIDQSRVQKYARLKKKVAEQREQLEQMQTKHDDKEDAIKQIESLWKPKLEEAIEKISGKFGEFFRQFNNAEGKIELANHRDADGEIKYSNYAIDIY